MIVADETTRLWLRQDGDERAVANGCHFDTLRAAWGVYWIERYCRLYEGEGFAGNPVVLHGCLECDHSDFYATEEDWWLDDDCTTAGPAQAIHLERARLFAECHANGHKLDWQYDTFMRLLGWVKHSERWGRLIRRFKQASIWQAKKNKKALDLDTPIPTPSGWTTIGGLSVGDLVFGEDGLPCKVVELHPVVTDDDCYQITFSNGEVAICNGEHLWKTTVLQQEVGVGLKGGSRGNQWTGGLRPSASKTAIRTTRSIAASSHRLDGACNHSLAMPSPLDLPDAKLPIDPYVFGAWLGDGDSDGARLTCALKDLGHWKHQFAAAGTALREPSVKPESNACRVAIGEKWSKFRTTLRAIGVLDNKHIPDTYLRGSYAQRLALLQGLMDTDGCIDKPGKCLTFVTTKEALRDGVAELVASLGIKFRVREQRAKIDGEDKGPCWWIQFHAFRDILPAFRLPRKLCRMRTGDCLTMKARSRTVQIISVEKVPSRPVRCITVGNSTGMFLFGRTMLPTHNSPSLAALGMYLWAGDGEPGQKVFLAAKDGEQVRTGAGKHVVEMWLQCDELKAESTLNRNLMQLTHEPSRSVMRPLSSSNSRTQQSKEGLNGSVLIDETHVVDREFVKIISRAGISRSEALFCEFSTAGNNPDGYGKERFDRACDVRDDKIVDEELLAVVYAAPQDVTDEQLGEDFERFARMANPAYGHTIDPVEIRNDYERSKAKIEDLVTFKMYRLNVWQHSSNPWLRPSDWAKCADTFTIDDLRGKTCYGGLDLSLKWDLTAFVLVFPWGDDDEHPEFRLWPYFFLPRESARKTEDKASWLTYEKDGDLIITEGDGTDFRLVEKTIVEASKLFNLQQVAFDPQYAAKFAQDIQDDHGIDAVEFRQSPANFFEPMDYFENRIAAGLLKHSRNRCMDWQIGNATKGRNGMLMKPENEYSKKIDGVVAGIMAMAMWMEHGRSSAAGSLFVCEEST